MYSEDRKKLPSYYIVEKEIEKMIEKLEPNDKLPSEKQLMDRFSVSRTTMRTALNNLSRRGLIYRKAGKGTFISPPRTIYYANILKGFTQEMKELGYNYSSEVVEQKFTIPDDDAREFFNTPDSLELFFLSRVRYMEDIPVAYQEAFINTSIDKELEKLLTMDYSGQTSLYQKMTSLGFPPEYGEEELKVERMSKFVSKLLKQPVNSCTLSRIRKTFDSEKNPLEYVRSFYRGDKYIFRFTLNKAGD
ncbi:MAG: GntR family transcriptional regulator [Kosmotoga sp.]|nr:MAG: GntR family transcriptional regulator [Kosmotoga sp.]